MYGTAERALERKYGIRGKEFDAKAENTIRSTTGQITADCIIMAHYPIPTEYNPAQNRRGCPGGDHSSFPASCAPSGL
jgi:hypothetical protein